MAVRSHSSPNVSRLLKRASTQRGLLFGALIITALLAFEVFNYSTTDFALSDLLGNLSFIGVRWATILAIAFAGIDFAGIARLFTPRHGDEEPAEAWYLFGAWLLAATMNAILTWWGVSIALLSHVSLGSGVIDQATLLRVVPVFVALMVWTTRILIIGTFSVAGERLFSQASEQKAPYRRQSTATRTRRSATARRAPQRQNNRPVYAGSFKPAPKPQSRPEHNYQQMSMSARPNGNPNQKRS
ncbi:MAG: hypothetical protein DWQ07_01100 [Chloroflexi bacterium]|nr:MAG: hypothetical protein DWQ07_01100 [Chloroflexota bacterium]MBL1196520.1 hypothetical protein [Chloroflexota bacterium]NOH13816.1 hypothetical protein [Chloroflexota bacterium]